MDYLIPDFDREVKARVGVMARCVRPHCTSLRMGVQSLASMQKWKERRGSAEMSSDLQVQEPCVHALQEW